MNPLDALHLQLRLEGKEVIHGDLLRQVEIVPDEEIPLMLIAQLADQRTIVYFDKALPSDLCDELGRCIPSLQFPNIDPVMDVLQSKNITLEIGHYKTYLFPEQYADIKTNDVSLFSKTNTKIQVFGFDGFTDLVHAIERDEKIVSACVSARENEFCGEAWVYTDPAYRRQGFAQRVVGAWARDLIHSGKVPLYSHQIQNNASANLAKQLGLYPIYEEIVVTRLAEGSY